jgi:hypothetical protein
LDHGAQNVLVCGAVRWLVGECEFHQHVELIYHSAALSLVLILGYLGFDRIGDGTTNDRLMSLIEDEVSLGVGSAREYFSTRVDFDFGKEVGRESVDALYFLRCYIGVCVPSEKPLRRSWKPQRVFSTYWLICSVVEKKIDWLPLLLAVVNFLKFFSLACSALIATPSERVLAVSLLIDFVSTAWIVQRVWRVSGFRKVLASIRDSWGDWLKVESRKSVAHSLHTPQPPA